MRLAYAGIAIGAIIVLVNMLYAACGLVARRRGLRRIVFDNLDSAAENGYFEPGEHLDAMTADEIAYDLTCYAEECGGYPVAELAPYVRLWLQKR